MHQTSSSRAALVAHSGVSHIVLRRTVSEAHCDGRRVPEDAASVAAYASCLEAEVEVSAVSSRRAISERGQSRRNGERV